MDSRSPFLVFFANWSILIWYYDDGSMIWWWHDNHMTMKWWIWWFIPRWWGCSFVLERRRRPNLDSPSPPSWRADQSGSQLCLLLHRIQSDSNYCNACKYIRIRQHAKMSHWSPDYRLHNTNHTTTPGIPCQFYHLFPRWIFSNFSWKSYWSKYWFAKKKEWPALFLVPNNLGSDTSKSTLLPTCLNHDDEDEDFDHHQQCLYDMWLFVGNFK